MVISVAIRGLLGLEIDPAHRCLHFSPALPAAWDHVSLRHLPYGGDRIDLNMRRSNGALLIEATSENKKKFCLCAQDPTGNCDRTEALKQSAILHLEPVELELGAKSPQPGSQTQQMKVLEESYSANGLTLLLEAEGGSIEEIPLRFNSARRPHLRVTGASLQEDTLRITFPEGAGYQKQKVLIEW